MNPAPPLDGADARGAQAAIRTARAPARLARRHGVRRALERWLAEADVARHGLPPQAIVLVRRLQARWSQLASPDRAARQEPLGALLAGAARPARGESGADAVWFADEAELLACLARDAGAGALAARWWWRLLLRDGGPQAARGRWLGAPRSVPRALLQLRAVEAGRWLAAWPPAEREALLQALARSFPIAHEVIAWAAQATPGSAPAANARVPVARPDLPIAVTPAAPQPVQRLLHLALALARDPMAGRELARMADGPPLATAAPALRRGRAAELRRVGMPGTGAPRPTAAASSGAATPVAVASPPPVKRTAPAAARQDPAQAVATHAAPAAWPPPLPGPAAGVSPSLPLATPTHATPEAAVASRPAATVEQEPLDQATPSFVDTSFGGLLFLLNLALQLRMYGDFTQPATPGLPCSPWRFLLAAGAALGGRRFARDPLAQWLRALAAPAGARRSPPWLAQCEALARAECERLALQPSGGPRRQPGGPWPWLRARLVLALGLQHPRQLAGVLLHVPARIEASGERLAVHMALADLPLAVRLAGLDRDPGWIPAAGRDVRFCFH